MAPLPRIAKSWVLIVAIVLLFAAAATFGLHHAQKQRNGPDAILERADHLAWLGNWMQAAPLYKVAEALFIQQHLPAKALYAQVSQIPAVSETSSLSRQIALLSEDLASPAARDPETRLRILVIRGLLETNYDAGMARSTWSEVQELADQRHHYLLASRAMGEQGIAAFMLGDIAQAKREVMTAWIASRVLQDPYACMRYASVFGAGLVEMQRYQEALRPLNEAIRTADQNPGVAYPVIAVDAKIDALRSEGHFGEALALANTAIAHIDARQKGHAYQLLVSRGDVFASMQNWSGSLSDYRTALDDARQLGYWRGVTQVGGILAQTYERLGRLHEALHAIDEAIQANTAVPDELYFVPRDLAIKADILRKLGEVRTSDSLYREGMAVTGSLLANAPTRDVERMLLSELRDLYSGYFVSLCQRHDYATALEVIEEARGRIEDESLQHHVYLPPHPPTPSEEKLIQLNVALINTDNPEHRSELTDALFSTEMMLHTTALADTTATHPVCLSCLQKDLPQGQLLLEYVLASPASYVLAITHSAVRACQVPDRVQIEQHATQYRSELLGRKVDLPLANSLFHELLGPVDELRTNLHLVVVPDGALQLLPFAALADRGRYLTVSHPISVVPSATVFDILDHRNSAELPGRIPYLGVAAWTRSPWKSTPVLRAAAGLLLSNLAPLPKSESEVESIAGDLPGPNTLLLGDQATETNFKRLPPDRYAVIHLALHGYADRDDPDQSALIFAPQHNATDDGLLHIAEIRALHLNASLVTLSACDTGVGPVGEDGVDNLSNAFIDAGADSVVSTLWDLEDTDALHLMEVFYRDLAAREPKASALRDAQLSVLQSGLPPYYWASFELIGDGYRTI
jgi:CHAT domain-containing protein